MFTENSYQTCQDKCLSTVPQNFRKFSMQYLEKFLAKKNNKNFITKKKLIFCLFL